MLSTIPTLLSRAWAGLDQWKGSGKIPLSSQHMRSEVIDERPMGRMDCVGRKGSGKMRLRLLRRGWVNVAAFVEKGVGRMETTGGLVEGITS